MLEKSGMIAPLYSNRKGKYTMRKNAKRLILLIFLAAVMIAQTVVMPASFASIDDNFSAAEGQDPVEILSDDCYGTVLGSEDYRKWAQADPRWGSIEMSTSGKTVAKIGCLVTSITKLIIKSKLRDSETFNVATLVNWLNANNGFSPYGDLYWFKVAQMIDGLEYEGADYYTGSTSSQAVQNRIMNYVRQNKLVVLHVKNKQHFIAVDNAKSLLEGEVYIMDSLNNTAGNADIALASRYPEIFRISLYAGGEPDTVPAQPEIENYIDHCTSVSSSVNGRIVNADAALLTLPCAEAAGQGSTVLGSIQTGSIVGIDAEIVNPAGECWYRLEVDGQQGYVERGSIEFAGYINDLEVIAPKPPTDSLQSGKSFSLTERIVSKHLITSVIGRITDINGNVIYSVTVEPNVRGEFKIETSQINNLLRFGQLANGHYAYEVFAAVNASSSLTDATDEFSVVRVCPFSVGVDALDTHTVIFEDGITGEVLATQTVASGFKPVMIEHAVHEGVEFLGWTNADKRVYADTVCKAVYGMRGDTDGNGELTIEDTVIVLRIALGCIEADEMTVFLSDLNADGCVQIEDVITSLRMSLGISA